MSEESKKTVLEQIEALQDTQEFKTLLENSNRNHWSSNIGGEIKKVYEPFDNAIKEVLGIDKPNDVKTTEFVKQQLLELKQLREKAATPPKKEEPSEKDKEATSLLTAQIEQYKKDLADKDNKMIAIAQEAEKQYINSTLELPIAQLKIDARYSESDLTYLVPARKEQIIKNSTKQTDGKVIYYKDEAKTEPYLNSSYAPMTAKEVVNVVFADMLQVNKQGGNTPPTIDKATEGNVATIDMSKVKTKADFYAQLNVSSAVKGLATHEKEFILIQKATEKHYNANLLPY